MKFYEYQYISFVIYITYLVKCSAMFGNGPRDEGSIPGRVIPKTQTWYLIPPILTLSNIKYVSRIKYINLGKGIAPSSTPRCCSDGKGSLRVTLDYGR